MATFHPGSALTGAPVCFPGQPHTPLPCLTDTLLASSAVLYITTAPQDWVSVGRFIPRLAPRGAGCGMRDGVSRQEQVYRHLFQHRTGRNIPGWLLPHHPAGGAKKRDGEKAEINLSLTSVHLFRVLPACQIKAPWKQQQAN